MVGEMSCNTATYISAVGFEVLAGDYEDHTWCNPKVPEIY
jgi:hypothetical protein